MKIRVAQIVGKWIGGGVESVIMNYYRNIDRNIVQFDFICDSDSTNIPYEEIKKLGGRVFLVPPYQKLFSYIKALKKIFKEENYKIVHSHINTLSVFPLYAAKKAGVKVRIAHSHSTTNKKEFKRNLIKQILRPFSKVYATNYMCCSEVSGRWLFGNKEYNKGNVYLLNNAIDLEKFKYNEEVRKAKRKELNIKDNTLVIGHIGRFVQTKNHDFLIDVFNEVHKEKKDSLLLLIGQGPLKEEIEAKVRKLNLSANVLFLGQREDVNDLYQAMDVFCLPSLYEGLGMTLIEAQVSGLPSIVSNNIPRESKINNNVKFLDLKIEKWSEEILKAINNKRTSYEKKCGESGYNIKNEVKKYTEYIQNTQKIKVCHVISGLISGGVETMLYNYCKKMNKELFEFHILYQHKPSEKNIKEFKNINVKLHRIPSKRKHMLANYFQSYRYFIDNNINIVHSHMNLMNFIPLKAARKANIKIRISHSHTNNITKNSFLIRTQNLIAKKLSIKYATENLACSENAGRSLYGNRNFQIIYNALDIEKYSYNIEARKNIREKYSIKKADILIGHIGRFVNVKNHKFILNIIKELNDKKYKFIFVGDGELREKIKNDAIQLGIISQIIFTGVIDNINEIYSAIDLFILPSLFEGIPLSAIEAQASGLKCLLSNNIDRNAVVDNKKVKQLDLDCSIWINEIKSINNKYDRKINIEQFNENHLNLELEYKKLENIYLKDFRKENK